MIPYSDLSFDNCASKFILSVCLSLTLAACNSYAPLPTEPSSSEPVVCSGFGCSKTPGKLPSRMETHKATKDEKIRARRGEAPNFGSEEWRIGSPVTF